MKKRTRGDDAKPAQEPVAEVTGAEGFPVSTAPASEASADDAAPADPADGPAEAGDDAVAAGESAVEPPLLKVDFKFHREFRKHAVTGTIVAIELVNGTLNGVRECSKPEEQTHGALPVLTLDDRESAVGQWYRAEAINFKTWAPPEPPKVLMDALMKLYEESVTARSVYESAKNRLKHAKAAVEDVDERVFHMLRRIHEVPDGQIELPLEKPTDEPSLPLEPEAIDPALDQHAQDVEREVAEQVDTSDGSFDGSGDEPDDEDRDERLAADDDE